MKAVGKIPDDLPLVTDLIDERPNSWLGRPIEWLNDRKPVLVFIERFVLPDTDCERRLFLFGARYDLRNEVEREVFRQRLLRGVFRG